MICPLARVPIVLLADFQVGLKIGEGSFAQVHKGRNVVNDQDVAIKMVKSEEEMCLGDVGVSYEDVLKAMHSEAKLLARVGTHPHVVNFLGRDAMSHMFILPLAETDLYQVIKKHKHLPFDVVTTWGSQILLGTSYIHSKGIVHQDLKSSNILIMNDMSLKICDFGLARLMPPNKMMGVDRELCTLWYRAPELIMGESIYTEKIDEWSVGCMLLELTTGSPPFRGNPQCRCSCPQMTHANFNSDQLEQIFKMVGSPTKNFVSLMPCQVHISHWPSFPSRLFATVKENMTADRMSTDCAEKMEAQIGVWCKVIGALLSIPLSKRTTCDAANTSLSQLLALRQSAQPEPVPASSSTCKALSSSLLQTSRVHTQSSGTEERTQSSASEDEQAAAERTSQRTQSSASEHDQATALMASRGSTLTPQEMQAMQQEMQLDSGAAASTEATLSGGLESEPPSTHQQSLVPHQQSVPPYVRSTNVAEPHGGDAPAEKHSFSIMLDSGSRSRRSKVLAVLERTCGQKERAKEVRTVDDLEVLPVHCQSGSPSSSCLSSQDMSAASPSSAKSRDLTPCTRPEIDSHKIIVRVRSEGF